ncbi:MAG: UDP-3-O-(3-hydroxymyristoyl)glucosamine N-acyltransferase [Candidatus Melainabacteria bacterium]|nr:UDP-3-O-(3-hydroxymyristoyl)glucosamine N-acyltransferase [Candidatus Melainabacteria bacterium]
MTDTQSVTPTAYTLTMLAQQLGGSVEGDGALTVTHLKHPLMAQQPSDLMVILDAKAFQAAALSPAICALVPDEIQVPAEAGLKGVLKVSRPRVALAILLNIFNLPVHASAGVHPTAVIDETAQVASSARIGPHVYVGPGAVVGENTILMHNVTVGAQAHIGNDCLLHPGARIGERVQLGHKVIIQHNASIGADGFSYETPEKSSIESARESGGKIQAQNTAIIRINSIGTVILEDEVEVGACACIDRGTLGPTLIRKGTKIDNLAQIGHNNTVGENCLIVSQVGVSGSCTIGNRVVLAGQVGLADHLTIGDDAIVLAKSGVMKDVPAQEIVGGIPALPRRKAIETQVNIHRLGKTLDEMKQLKNRLAELETQIEALQSTLQHNVEARV